MFYRLRNGGFTLPELVITLVVLAILITIAYPGWSTTIERYRAQRLQSELRTLFNSARMTAVHESSLVTICPLNAANVCSNDWNARISVFLDPDKSRSLSSHNHLIRFSETVDGGNLQASSSGHGERRYFQYNSDGTVRGTIGHLRWCSHSATPETAFQLRLNFGGRIRWAQDTDDDGIAEMSDGSPLTC